MSGVSKVFKICDAYESGFGHGFKNSGMKNTFDKAHEPELFEAYGIGYNSGKYKYERVSHEQEKQSIEENNIEKKIKDAADFLESFIDEASSAMGDCCSCGNAIRLSEIISINEVHEALKILNKNLNVVDYARHGKID